MPIFGGSLYLCCFFFLLLPSRLQPWRRKMHPGILGFTMDIISWVWKSPRLLALLVQQSLFYFYFEASGFSSTCHPASTELSSLGDVFKSVFYRGKLGKNVWSCLEVQDVFFQTTFFNDEKITRKFPSQTSGCIAIPVNRKGFAVSPFRWGCLKRHLSEIGMIVNPDRGIKYIKLN